MNPPPPPPAPIGEYAQTCSRYVQTALGLALDFEPETLPLLDHYLRQARDDSSRRPETLPLIATVAGSYLGELLRRRHACAWIIEDPQEPLGWQLDFEGLDLAVFPIAIAREALTGVSDPELVVIALGEEDRKLVAERLARLPAVREDDFFAPSTRVEVIDIAVDIMLARKHAATPSPED